MSGPQTTMLLLLAGILVLFVWGRWRYDLIAFGALLVAVLLGLVEPSAAFAGFGHPAVVTVAVVLILSRALSDSPLIALFSRFLEQRAGDRPPAQIGALGGVTSILSAFINNVGALALFMPVALRSARRAERPPGLLLMPLAFAAILGGLVTLIGTPPNIIVAAYRAETTGEAFAMFDFAPVGLPVALAGVLFVAWFGWRLIPRERREGGPASKIVDFDDYVTEIRVPAGSPLIGRGKRQLQEAFGGARLLGLVRNHRLVRTAAWRGRVREDEILVVEVGPDDIGETIRTLGLEPLGLDREEAEASTAEDRTLVEAVVSPRGRIEGRTARGVGFRGRYDLELLAVSRQGRRTYGRLQTLRFQAGDVLLIRGPEKLMPTLLAELGCLPLLERNIGIGASGSAWLPVGVFAAAMAAASTGMVAAPVALGAAAAAMLLLGTISLRDAYDSVDWPIIVLLGAMIPIGGALETTGTAALITDAILSRDAAASPIVVLVLVMIVTMTLSDIVNNAATAVIMAPIGAGLAGRLGTSADPFLMAVAIGASCAFLTPIGHQNNTLVMGPGGYRFGDYWRMGLPLELLIVATSIPLLLVFWPF